MQALAHEMSRVAIRELLKRGEYFVTGSKVEAMILESKCVEKGAVASICKCLHFSASQQARTKALSTRCWRDPKNQDVEPAPVNLAKDTPHECVGRIARHNAKLCDFAVTRVFRIGAKQVLEKDTPNGIAIFNGNARCHEHGHKAVA
jgi:hypothetical protein